MALEATPPRKLKTQIERVRDDAQAAGTAGGGQRITVESVTAIHPGNKVTVLGFEVPVTGDGAGINVGQRVAVAWKSGQPTAVIFHHAQSAQFVPTLGADAGIVEELYIAANDSGQQDVFFRNAVVDTTLGLRKPNGDGITHLTANPLEVFWGVRPDTFAVRTGTETYHVFKLSRKADKVTTGAPSVKEKLYTKKLSDNVVQLSHLTVKMHRDSVERHFLSVWNFLQGGNPSFFLPATDFLTSSVVDTVTNVNKADCTRELLVNLHGLTVEYQALGGFTTGQILSGQPANAPITAAIAGAIVDENDDLIVSVSLSMSQFGLQQGPQTGVTGQYLRRGDGNVYPFGFFNTFRSNLRTDPAYPFVVDDVGILAFGGLGNPGGVLAASVTQTHCALVNVRQGTLAYSTVAAAPTLTLEESTNGQLPYNASHYTGFQDLGLHDPNVGPDHGMDYGFRPAYQAVFGPITLIDYGQTGLYGVIKSERDLFAPGLTFQPTQGLDPIGGELDQILDQTQDNVGWITERTDGWDSHGGSGGGFFTSANQCLEQHWKNPTVRIEDRFEVRANVVPFFSKAGLLYSFVSVIRLAKNPSGAFPGDKSSFGVFVLQGTGAVTVMPYTLLSPGDTDAPVFMSGNQHHVLWKRGKNWFLSDFTRGLSAQVGDNAGADDPVKFVLTENDFLYDTAEKRRYFVQGWNRGSFAITLNQADPKFPPREGALAVVRNLKNSGAADVGGPTLGHFASWIPSTDGKRSYHTIMDKTVLPGAYKAL